MSHEEGLTGKVFVEQRDLKFATAKSDRGGHFRFEPDFELTEEQEETIHVDLRWIVSFPLTLLDGEHRKPAAVLNVDGLNHELGDDDLNLLHGWLISRVEPAIRCLERFPKVRVMILVRDE